MSDRSFIGVWLFGALLVAAVSVASPQASADWVGNIITERPAGQAFESGLADETGDVQVLGILDSNTFLILTGHGTATISLEDGSGNLLAEATCSGAVTVGAAFDQLTGRGHVVEMVSRTGQICFFDERGLMQGDTALIEIQGAFSCTSNLGCDGSQNGKLIFQLTVDE